MSRSLEDYYGACSTETMTDLERIVSERRTRRSNGYRERVWRIVDALE